jgi:hypothetical protein
MASPLQLGWVFLLANAKISRHPTACAFDTVARHLLVVRISRYWMVEFFFVRFFDSGVRPLQPCCGFG